MRPVLASAEESAKPARFIYHRRKNPYVGQRMPWSPLQSAIIHAYRLYDEAKWWDGDINGFHVTDSAMAKAIGRHPRQVTRWRVGGLAWDLADEIAVDMGMHPSQIWSEWLVIPDWDEVTPMTLEELLA